MTDAQPVVDVVVVGGGVAGLVAARDLAAGGLRVVVLESRDRLGGCVVAHEVAGLRLDAGAESFATRSPAVGDLLTELGLGADVVTPTPAGAWVRLADRTVPLPRAGVLGIPGRLWSRDVRAAIGLIGSLRATADRLLPGRVGLGPEPDSRSVMPPGGRSLGRLVRVRFGRRVHDRLVAPVVTGVHSARPDDVDLDLVLPGVRPALLRHGSVPGAVSLAAVVARTRAAAPAGSAVAGLDGGMNRLVTALAEDLARAGVVVRTGVTVEAVAPVGDSSWWVMTSVDGVHQGVPARRLVLAVPGPAAALLLRELVPEVDALSAVSDAGAVLATLVLDAPALDSAPRGTGVLVAEGAPGVTAKALTHATAKWAWLAEQAGPGRHVLRLSYGRAGSALPLGSGDHLLQTALVDASTLLGIPLDAAQVVGFSRTVWDGGLPRPLPGQSERVTQVRAALRRLPGTYACGAWFAGTGLAAVVADARATAADVLAAVEGGGPHSAPGSRNASEPPASI